MKRVFADLISLKKNTDLADETDLRVLFLGFP
jgi:hypothetical protein